MLKLTVTEGLVCKKTHCYFVQVCFMYLYNYYWCESIVLFSLSKGLWCRFNVSYSVIEMRNLHNFRSYSVVENALKILNFGKKIIHSAIRALLRWIITESTVGLIKNWTPAWTLIQIYTIPSGYEQIITLKLDTMHINPKRRIDDFLIAKIK